MTNNTNNVAQTILEQLGGSRFIAMTGAKNLLAGERELRGKIGRNSAGVTHFAVVLNGADLYDVEFLSVRGTKVRTVSESSMVHVESLRAVFEKATGLYVSL